MYFLAARLGLVLAFEKTNASPVWPPSGIAFGATLLLGTRVWPGVAIGALLANVVVFAGNRAGSAAAIAAASSFVAIGNTIEAVSGALLGRWLFGANRPFESARGVFKLVLVALLMCLTSATIGPTTICLAGLAPWAAYRTIWFTWWLGDVAGVLVLTPLLAALWERPWRSSGPLAPRALEAAALLVILGLVGPGVFFGWLDGGLIRRESYLLIPILLWAVFRFGRFVAAAAVVLAAGIAIWGTVNGSGPFSGGTLNESLLLLQAYVCVLSMMTMSLWGVLSERLQSEEKLRSLNETLETRVRERTAEVARANDDLRTTNVALEKRTIELAQRSEEVEAFVYSVSHDLRAPLVNTQGFSRELDRSLKSLNDLLRDVTLPPAVRSELTDFLEHDFPTSIRFIVAGTTKSERLINALLLLSRSGREELHPEVLDADALVRAALDALQGAITHKQAQVTVGPLPEGRGDATAIGRVFSNLLGNALHYLRPGVPGRIEIGGERRAQGAEYWVRDNGSGLSAAAQERLFRHFQRFHPKMAEGEGMGLAIVKRLVERHGGRVWAESEEGKGSTFHFTLPGDEHDGSTSDAAGT